MKEPELSNFVVVLCRAEESGNVGAACRAMKTMGITRLALAACPAFDEARIATMAVHAFDVYEKAAHFPDLDSALAESSLVAGFTRRRGERRKVFSLSVADFARRALESPTPEGATAREDRRRRTGEVALVFGNERTGLTDAELSGCSLAVHIPSSAAFPSLNLAQAVQIACYELRRQSLGEGDGSALPATRFETEAAVSRIAESLRSLGFFKLTQGRDLAAFLRDTVLRAAYTPSELRYFEAMFQKTAALAKRDRRGGDI